jgi:proteasome accessory factor B
MPDTPQIERQLYILQLLAKNHTGFTSDEIRSKLMRMGIEVSKKTIDRDIDSLSIDFGIYEETRNNKTYYIADKININDIAFDFSELLSLYFIRELLKAYKGIDVGRTAHELVERIIASVPRINKEHINALGDMVKVSLPDVIEEKELNPDILEKIEDGISNFKRIEIKYYSFNKNEITERRVDPYLVDIDEGCYHLIGYCHLRNSIRDFRISRIKDILLTDESFIKPEGFYDKYKQSKFDKLAGSRSTTVKVRFRGYAARYVKEYEKSKADKIVLNPDGTITFIRKAALTDDLSRWILGYGDEAEVLEPAELKEMIKETVENMYRSYKDK